MAAIKAKAPESKERKLMYEMLKAIHNDPEYDTIASLYTDRIGSDLDEEVLCNKIEKILSNQINRMSDIDLSLYQDGIIYSELKSLFPNLTNQPIEELLNINLETAIENYAYSLFKLGNQISTDAILGSQKLAQLKQSLYKSRKKDNKLKQEC